MLHALVVKLLALLKRVRILPGNGSNTSTAACS